MAKEERDAPAPVAPQQTGNIDAAILEAAEKVGQTGLTEMQSKVTEFCKNAFGDTSFTVAMFCAQTGVAAKEGCDCMTELHALGIVRCPVNDGGQVLYQVMPGVVHPQSARARF